MNQQVSSSLLDSIRQQFNFEPYLNCALETTPKHNFNLLYSHSLVTPYYLRHQRVFDTRDAVILDAGCGTGFKALTLAYANPGARIVGIDISEKSIEVAQQRFAYHGLSNAEFHVLGIEDIVKLDIQFDYINCDEVLYLFPEPAVALSILRANLKPHGIIRGNLHSLLQRAHYFRAQNLFGMMGLMDGNPEELEIGMVMDIIAALRDDIDFKQCMSAYSRDSGKNVAEIRESMLMNLLFQGDRGFTIPDVFNALTASVLEFVSMVEWRRWEVLDLFKDPDDLPALLAFSLPEASAQERLRMYELINPVNRLLDFWCGHPGQSTESLPVGEWCETDWRSALIQIHPVLCHERTRELLTASACSDQPCKLNQSFNFTSIEGQDWIVESTVASMLLPLLDGPQPISVLVDRYLQVRPVDPVTLAPFDRQTAFERVTTILRELEIYTYILVERSANPL
jgi:SAM-dependent methyltransferase